MQSGSDEEHEGTAITSRRKPSEQADNIYPGQENAIFQADCGLTIKPSTAEGMDDKCQDISGLASATLTNNSNANVNVSIFRAIAKNVRGMADEDRIRELLHETKT